MGGKHMPRVIVALPIALLGLISLSRALWGQDFGGTYTVQLPDGAMTLTLRQADDGTVAGTLAGQAGAAFQVQGSVVVDEDDEASVEGALEGPQQRSEFAFYANDAGDGYALLVTPYDASGIPRLDLAAEYPARRAEEPEGGLATVPVHSAPTPVDAMHDPRLVGIWATQVLMNTPGGNMATQLFMEIRADGTLVDMGSRSMGGLPGIGMETGAEGGGETVAWRTQGNVLQVSYAGSQWAPLAQFEVSGNRLLLVYYDGDRKLWYRQ
jgi:hypothetical protein